MFVSSLPFIVAMTILLKICKFLEMLINHFQIENKKIQVEILGFFIWSARYGTNKRSRKISCYNDFRKNGKEKFSG